MEWFGNKNPQLLKAGGTLAATDSRNVKNKMKLFSLYKENNTFEAVVYESLEDFTKRTEWQDIIDDYFTIIDNKGRIYKWDDSKKEEYGTVYNYTLKIDRIDTELSKACLLNYEANNYATEFKFKFLKAN